MKRIATILLMLVVGSTLAFSQARPNDPGGANTGNASAPIMPAAKAAGSDVEIEPRMKAITVCKPSSAKAPATNT